MRVDALLWLAAAVTLLAGGVLGLAVIRRRLLWLFLTLLVAGLTGILAGLGWRTWQAGAWSGALPADGLALLAGGALAVIAWMALRWAAPASLQQRPTAPAAALLGAGLLIAAATLLAWRGPAPAAAPLARSWLFGLRGVFASVGLGGWLSVLAASAVWRVAALFPHAPTGEAIPPAKAISPAADPGRPAALFSYPWLTAAALAGAAWNLVVHVAVVRAVPGDLWLLVTWLCGGVYLHVTSGWRPLRLPAWLATLLAAATLAAAVLAALNAATVL